MSIWRDKDGDPNPPMLAGLFFGLVLLSAAVLAAVIMILQTVLPDKCAEACGSVPVRICEYNRIECAAGREGAGGAKQ